MSATSTPELSNQASTPEQRYTLRQRVSLWLITWAGFLAIHLICPTLRFALSSEEGAPETATLGKGTTIYSFWHRCVFPAAYLWRNLQIRVMTSQSFDGEYIARIIQKFGFVAVRGSSTRGGARALLEMRQELEQGRTMAFTIDGPRGPRYVAKPGPVLLARATGAPLAMFYIAAEHAWVLNTWDQFMIPKPFSKALMRTAKLIVVPGNADDAEVKRLHGELQASLDRVREFAEANVHKVGSAEFPIFARNA